MPLADLENWLGNDPINDSIWPDSPDLQAQLAQQFPVSNSGSVGGQQAMFTTDGPTHPLPWVPDLAGKRSNQTDAVMLVGSAYAPFVTGFTTRVRSMHLPAYANAANWHSFQQEFLGTVVAGDPAYYGRLQALLNPAPNPHEPEFNWQRLILMDWCRASFVRRGDATENAAHLDRGGDGICAEEGAGVFFHYVSANRDWHAQRLRQFRGKIVLLGNLSHTCLSFFCHSMNWPITYHLGDHMVDRPNRLAQFRNHVGVWITGRVHIGHDAPISFTAIKHPSRMTTPEANALRANLSAWLD